MDVNIIVTTQVKLDGNEMIDPIVAQQAAFQAVTSAIEFASDNGFEHGYDNSVCVEVVDITILDRIFGTEG